MIYSNPYFDTSFFEFTALFFKRLLSLQILNPTADEVQLLVLVGIAISCTLVGTFLVLRKMVMIANSLSHTILLGIAAAFFFSGYQLNLPLLILCSLAMSFFTVFMTEWLTSYVKLQEDAATGLVFTTFFALGIVFVTLLTRSAHIGTEAVMGHVDALQATDLYGVLIILLLNAIVFFTFYKEFKITTFDPAFAGLLGFSTIFFNYLLMTLVSFTVIGAFRSVGVLMVLGFLTIPPLTARMVTHRLSTMIFYGIGVGSIASFMGVALSRHILTVYGAPLSTAGLIIVILTLLFAIHYLITRITLKERI